MNAQVGHVSTPGLRSAERAPDQLVLILNNTLAAIEAGRLELLDFLGPAALDPRVVNRLEVVFEEVIANIVRHGFAPGADQAIRVAVQATPDTVQLVFEDEGRPFDVTVAPDPPHPTSLETAPLGGLGVPLIHKLARSLRYETPEPGEASCHLGGRPFAPRNRLFVTIARAA
jgi:serine/threonine-protein kinase RsbW